MTLLGGLVALGGCAAEVTRGGRGGTIDPVTPRPDGGTYTPPGYDSGPPPVTPPTQGCDKMDILFIVDDSGSMEEEQENLRANFPRFVEVLNGYTTDTGAPLDYRIGVTTTGVAINIVLPFPIPIPLPDTPDGALIQGCGMGRRWIERADGDVAGIFSCVADVGTDGSGMEMPLRATELAITERVSDGTNAGFLRDDALLAVVMLTDEDDCSNNAESVNLDMANPDMCDKSSPTMPPPSYYLEMFDRVKGDRGRWAAAVIAGPGPGTCTSSFGEADDGERLREFVGAAGANVVFSSICEGDLAGAVQRALDTFDAACESFPPLI